MSRAVIVATLVVSAWPTVAWAQASVDEPNTIRRAQPPLTAPGATTVLQGIDFDLAVDPDKSESSVTLNGFLVNNASGNTASRPNITWSAKGTLPVGGGDDLTANDLLDSLANGPSIGLSLGLLGFNATEPTANMFAPQFTSLMELARRRCEETAKPADAAKCRSEHSEPDPQFARRYVNPYAVNRALFSGFWRAQVEGKVGWKRYDYRDPATLAERHDNKKQYSGSLIFGYYPGDAMSALIGRVEYQDAFEATDSKILCKAVVISPADDCVEGAPAGPTPIERLNLSAAYSRVLINDPRFGMIAIAPLAKYDILNDEWAAELPVYIGPKDWPIAPAVVVSYSSETDEFDLGFKLRASFSFD